MRKIALIFLLSLFISSNLKAQIFRYYSGLDSLQTEVSFQSENFVQSNFLTQKVTSDIIFSNYITPELIEKMQNKLDQNNLLNAETRQSFNFNYKVDSNFSIGLNVVDRILSYGLFTNDFITVLSSGNRSDEGELYNFSGTNINFFKFQEIGVNAKYVLKIGHQIGLNINYINVESFNKIALDNTTFNVNQFGTETDIEVTGMAQFSDSTNKSFASNNGNGFSISGSYSAPIKILKNQTRQGFATLYFKDIGSLFANNKTLNFKQEGETYSFDGIYIENLTNYRPRIFEEQSPDTILQRILNTANFAKTSNSLPWLVGFTIMQPVFENSSVSFGSYFRNISGSLPLFYGSYQTKINKTLSLEVNSNAGGFGNFSLGAGAEVNLNNLRFKLATANLNGLLLRQTNTGLGVFAEIKYLIK